MVSFRFHLVSLTAIFLALALGTAIGATVVDRATVDLLEDQLSGVERRADERAAENTRLEREVAFLDRSVDQAEPELVGGRLTGVPVLVVTVRGTSGAVLDSLREALGSAGAQMLGTLIFTERMQLDSEEHLDALTTILGATPARADTIRRLALQRIAQRALDPAAENILPALRDAAFVQFEAPSDATVDLAALPLPETRFVVVSGSDPAVPDADVAIPFVAMTAPTGRVVAADASGITRGAESAARAPFVSAIRTEADVAGRVSTVDNATESQGRVAVVLALAEAGAGRYGHYGRGPRATRVIPATAA